MIYVWYHLFILVQWYEWLYERKVQRYKGIRPNEQALPPQLYPVLQYI